MPKKFQGENSKAAVAKARKEAKKVEEREKKLKEEADRYWQDDDKHAARKQQRKEEKERKRSEHLERKQKLKQLHDEEMSTLKGKTPKPTKVTRADIQMNKELEVRTAAAEKEKELPADQIPIEENINKIIPLGEDARSVEEALSILSVKGPEIDRHPERRLKAAFNKFEEENLPRLKIENPNLRLSQLKQMLKKEWMKSANNPLNQNHPVLCNSK